MSHLNCVHSAGVSSGADVDYKDALLSKLHTHTWSGQWEVLPAPSSHIGRLTLSMTNTIFGIAIKAINVTAVADQVSLRPSHIISCCPLL